MKSSFAQMIEKLIEEKQLSQKDLADRTGLSPGYISLLTRGERTTPSKKTVKALAGALRLDTKTEKLLFEMAGYLSESTSSTLVGSDTPHYQIKGVGQKEEDTVREDWGEAPNVKAFYGRCDELTKLEQWIVDNHCQMLVVLGIGGVGKTMLSAKLAEQIKDEFDYLFWRSLQDAPPLESLLKNCIQFLSNKRRIDLPEDINGQMSVLLQYLREHRCLLVLDNIETILQSDNRAGQYRKGYEGYGKLFQLLGEVKHQSCLLVTSREKPKEIPRLEKTLPVRSIYLSGVEQAEAREILKDEGLFGSDNTWTTFIDLYSGNPLALKLVSEPIRELFEGDIAAFLKEEDPLVADIYDLVDQQFRRLSELEQEIVYWLAIEREAMSLDNLREDFMHLASKGELLEALRSLKRRSMIETRGTARFCLQPVIMEYATNRFVEQVSEELFTEHIKLLVSHAIIKAQAKDYVRNSQVQLILKPLVERLLTARSKEENEKKLQSILSTLHETSPQKPVYAAGNILNLLIHLRCDLRGYDFSHLRICQAHLQGAALPDVNFAHADLSNSVFTETFGSILSVAFSPNGELLTAGTTNGEIQLWDAITGTPLLTYEGHTDWVRSVAFSPNNTLLVSGSDDRTVRLWDVNTGQCLKTLQEHDGRVRTVAFSPDGSMLASGDEDQTVRLWDVNTGQCLKALQGHSNQVYSVAFSPDGSMLASGGEDQTVRLWDVNTGQCLKVLQGHSNRVWSVAFSPEGNILASGSDDRTIQLWEVSTGQHLQALRGHTHRVRSVAFSADGKALASCGEDQTVRLWDVTTGQWSRTLQGHSDLVKAIAFSPDGSVLASGSDDQTIRLWEVSTGNCLKTLQGYTNAVRSVAFSPDGSTLASGSEDQTIRLWESSTGHCLNTLQAHSNWVHSVTFSPDGSLLASGSQDQTVRLWEVSTGRCLKTLRGHSNLIRAVAFSPDGSVLASGSDDQTIQLWEVNTGYGFQTVQGYTDRVWSVAFSPDGKVLASGGEDWIVRLWEVSTGQCLKTLQGHSSRVRSITFSPDGSILASGSEDQTICLWEVSTGQCLKTLQGHHHWVRSVAFSLDGKVLASGSQDQTVHLWDVSTGQCLKILRGHTYWVYSVAFGPDRRILASSSNEGIIKLWEIQTGECLQTLQSERPYEGMNITGVKGLTEAQKAMLRALGAIEDI